MFKTKTILKIVCCALTIALFSGYFVFRAVASDPAPMLINEIAPSETRDWIEFYVTKSQDFGEYRVKEGVKASSPIITAFPANFNLATGDFVILHFEKLPSENNETTSKGDNDIWDLYTSDLGLQATDNVITLEDKNGQVIDAMCYANQDTTWSGHQATFDNLLDTNQWLPGEKNKGILTQGYCFDWTNSGTTSSFPANKSMGRNADYTDTNSKSDWQVYETQTPGQQNIIADEPPTPTYSDKIIINEIYPNPSDQNAEFIELKNLDAMTVDMKDWRVADKRTNYKIKSEDFLPLSTLITPAGFFVVPKSISGIALNNAGGEMVSLIDPNNRTVSAISYSENAPENESFALFSSGWSWTSTITPGVENVLSSLPPVNHNPKAVAGDNKKVYVDESVTFDGADSYDPDSDALVYTWDFGDKTSKAGATVTHKYKKTGKYTAKLKVEDGRGGLDEDTVLVTVSEKKKVVTKKTTKKKTKKSTKKETKKEITKKPKGPFSRRIAVTEIMPNPTGRDTGESGKDKTGEWIEIKNNEKHEVNLSYWQIDDEENNDTPHTLENVKIRPGKYLVFYYADLKVTLNNDKDKVRIFDPDGKIAYKVSYAGSKEGLSYAIDEKTGKWYWTQKPTPGKTNVIDLIVKKPTKKIDDDEEDTDYDDDEFDIIDDDEDTDDTEETTDNETTDLSDVMEMDNGEEVRVKGWISSAPGIFSKDIFYMQDSTGGIQIYFSKADFPKLIAGDIVSVVGKTSSLAGEKKINVSQKSDIKFMSHSSPPKPEKLEIGEIDESYMGQLISTTGTIAKKIGQNLYLENAGEQIRAYLEKGISLSAEISKGKEIMVAGVLSQTKAGLRILPRNKSDVALAKVSTKNVGTDNEEATAESADESTDSAQVGNSLGIIILFSMLATGVVAAFLFITIARKPRNKLRG